MFIDCLYNTLNGEDISRNEKIAPICEKVRHLKDKYGITIVVICHMNKGNHEVGLSKDRLTGASHLINWAEHIILATGTNEDAKRLIKVDKSRHIHYSEAVYLLHWDSKKFQLINQGVCRNVQKFIIGKDTKFKWEKALNEMEDKFTSSEFIEYIESIGKSSRTGYDWLKSMTSAKVIEKDDWGKYRKVLEIVGEE